MLENLLFLHNAFDESLNFCILVTNKTFFLQSTIGSIDSDVEVCSQNNTKERYDTAEKDCTICTPLP